MAQSSEQGPEYGKEQPAVTGSDLAHDERADDLLLLAQLAGGIAHELRNPLSTIGASAWFLKRRLESADPGHDQKLHNHIDRIAAATNRSRGILDAVLWLAHTRQPRRRRVDLRHVVTRTLTGLDVSNGVTVTRDYLSQELPARIDEDQVEIALHNLISNAMDAMHGQGRLTISGRQSNEEMQVAVNDTGPGIAAEHLSRVFEPFFTTKAGGTGLGLTLAELVARRHGGRLVAESGQGCGATFTLCIPVAEEADSRTNST
ncbi:MAG: two-component system sensor histidine kinase NtrB [Chloroflexota bacterium]